MEWLRRAFGRSAARRQEILTAIQSKFAIFRELLDSHNQTLKRISLFEEKFAGNRPSGMPSFWDEYVEIRRGVGETIERMVALGGNEYDPLQDRFSAIADEVEKSLVINRPIARDDYVIPFQDLRKERAFSAGTKSAILGELKSRLDLPVPDGFAISAWAYQHFLETNHLSERIRKLLDGVRIRSYQDLQVASEDIREAVTTKPVPDDLAQAIHDAFDKLVKGSRRPVCALRSSAIGEDTAFSFAGQYSSFLGVSREDLLDRYKQIIASKFTPSAIYYLLSHSLSEMDLGMGAACMEMVDAAASGVVYTVDPLHPEDPHIVVNSIYGLGSYLVNGTITPDVFHISRIDKTATFARTSAKSTQLKLGPGNDIQAIPTPEPDQRRPSVDNETLGVLVAYALRIEEHFGGPQDIEWALDESGKLFLLQARSLNIPAHRPVYEIPAEYQSLIMLDGGTPVCAGIGTGAVFHLTAVAELDRVPQGAVLVTPNPSPYLVAVMHKINALVTMTGGNTSHLATLARELGVPTVVGMTQAHKLPANREVTVDASRGVIYEGSHPEWIPAPAEAARSRPDSATDELVRKIIAPVIHLNVIHPSDPAFVPDNCRTFHDLLRFVHQKSMEEIFVILKRTSDKEKIGLRLKTKTPLAINVIYLDQNYLKTQNKRRLAETEIQSPPMQALWGGILEEGWPEPPGRADLKGFIAVIGTDVREGHKPEFSENSYAFLSREYMLLNLRMGYHFQTIEAMATPEPEKNYIRMQFKLGGASLERRIRRIWLISELLRRAGFENSGQGDFLDSSIAYQPAEGIMQHLRLLGRITILTKQLDITLSSDAKARWYLKEFTDKLAIKVPGD